MHSSILEMKLLLEWIQNLYLMIHHQIHQLTLSLPYAISHVDFETIPAVDMKSIQCSQDLQVPVTSYLVTIVCGYRHHTHFKSCSLKRSHMPLSQFRAHACMNNVTHILSPHGLATPQAERKLVNTLRLGTIALTKGVVTIHTPALLLLSG